MKDHAFEAKQPGASTRTTKNHGSSLRAGEIPAKAPHPSPSGQIIHARGEESSRSVSGTMTVTDHPRARGGILIEDQIERHGQGSSTHAGKNLQGKSAFNFNSRIIHARGEESLHLVTHIKASRDHPRARGGIAMCAVQKSR